MQEYVAVDHGFTLPRGMNFGWGVRHCLQSTGHIFLLHRGQHRLVELDPSGNFVGAYGDGMFERA